MQVRLVLLELLLTIAYIETYPAGPKIAVNKHLLVWLKDSDDSYSLLQYRCLTHNDTFHLIDVELTHIYSISIGRQQNESQLYFIVAGLMNTKPYMSKMSVNCINNQFIIETVSFNESEYQLGRNHFVVNIDAYGKLAIGYTPYAILYYDLINLKYWSKNIRWNTPNAFLPTAVDITTHSVYVVGYFISTSEGQILYSKANLYLMEIDFNNSNDDVNVLDVWTSDDFPCYYGNPCYVSLSINYNNDERSIFVGIPSANTIHVFSINYTTSIHFEHISSKTQSYIDGRTGYGAGFTWLNQGKILTILYSNSENELYSILYYYDMLNNVPITNDTIELAIFPDIEQVYPEKFDVKLIYIISSLSIYSTLYGYNSIEQLLVIPPSLPGYYSVAYRSIEDVSQREKVFPLVPNSAQCPPGTYKNDTAVWSCHRCKPIERNSSILHDQLNNNITITCPQCKNETACPLEFVTATNLLGNVKQNGIYPESPETDIFDDVLLYYIFDANSNFNSPFFILIIILLIVLIITGIISLLRLSKRFATKQKYFRKFIQHFDLIGEGSLWFGGLLSIVLLVIVIFAAKFGHVYHERYPIEKEIYDMSNFHNAKFETSLQLLGTSTDEHEQIFNLLDTQEFILNIEILNTLINCGSITLAYEPNGAFLPFSCYTKDRILYLSAKLPVHKLNVILNLFSNYTIDTIRIGLFGWDTHLNNNYLQKLNFSTIFNRTNQTLSNNSIINLQLTKSINITEPLTDKDNTTYTGLWLPTFFYDVNQLFTSLNTSQQRKQTILSLEINQTPFFIKNKQKPIARRSEIIFHTILFIGVCIDLTCMMLLLLKLWFSPIIIYGINKLFSSKSFIYRLIHNEATSSESSAELEIQKLKEQNEVMSKRIDKLMDILSNIQKSHPTINEETLYLREKF